MDLYHGIMIFIESSIKDFNINHGVYIDIIPIDYYEQSIFKEKTLRNEFAGMRRFL